ncbi:hypothetical protein PTT_11612 [Pyrenophora teres f. teres 0-1]|uniref:Uncharacterized protein n=1 Tax=Pyrenophora teres f. teres (strain 0-1) TaxID=861557 RepID=E3RRX1_PYRTT|nr:hypothetical protein PTT_11612 [Pyrenophora teres f. teres 0-1]
MSNNNVTFTPREMEVLALAWHCMESQPKIDMNKLASLTGYTPGSATVTFGKIKHKIKLIGDSLSSSGPAPPKNGHRAKATTTSTPKKRTMPTSSTPPSAKRSKQVLLQDNDNLDDDDEDFCKKEPVGGGGGVKAEIKREPETDFEELGFCTLGAAGSRSAGGGFLGGIDKFS